MNRILLITLLLTFIGHARAELLIEPVIGYNFGSGEFKGDDAFEKVDLDANGVGYGGRLGYQNMGFQLGLDYLASSLDLGDDSFEKNATTSEFAAFVGFEFPVLIRAYAGYVFSATAETETDNSEFEFMDGSGAKFGVGFTGLPIIDINLEYRMIKYDKVESDGDEQDIDVNYNAVFISLSAPFTF